MKKLIAICTLVILSACQSLPAPQSFDQGLAYGYTTNAAVRNTAADLLNSNTISVADAKVVQNLANEARAALDLASNYSKQQKPTDAKSALDLANSVLQKIQDYLASKRK